MHVRSHEELLCAVLLQLTRYLQLVHKWTRILTKIIYFIWVSNLFPRPYLHWLDVLSRKKCSKNFMKKLFFHEIANFFVWFRFWMPSFLGAHAKASLKAAVVNAGLGQSALNFEIKPYRIFLKIFLVKKNFCCLSSLFCNSKTKNRTNEGTWATYFLQNNLSFRIV